MCSCACRKRDLPAAPSQVRRCKPASISSRFERAIWDAYERAVCNMVDRTSTEIAPWTLVEANDKSFARVKVLKTLCERIGKAL